MTPYEVIYRQPPSVKQLQHFGRKYFLHIPKGKSPTSTKLTARDNESMFVEYSNSNNLFSIYMLRKFKIIKSLSKTDFLIWTQKKSLLSNNYWKKPYQSLYYYLLLLNIWSISKITMISIYHSHSNLYLKILLNQYYKLSTSINRSR